jgi:hypothetical protein
MIGELPAEPRVDAIRQHDEIGFPRQRRDIIDLLLECEIDAEIARPLVKNEEQGAP